jgi:hypothetical protein
MSSSSDESSKQPEQQMISIEKGNFQFSKVIENIERPRSRGGENALHESVGP